MPICPACGKEQIRTSAFCSACGAVLDRPSSATESAQLTADSPQSPSAAPPTEAAGAPGVTRPARAQAASLRAAHAHDVGDIGAYIVRRFLALCVDLFFVAALIAVAARALIANATHGELTASGFVELALVVLGAIFAYRWLFTGFAGTTLGKLLFGLGVARADGEGAGLGRAFVRELLLPIDLAIIGFLLAAVLPRRRRLGDIVAGTVVANARIGALAPVLGIVLLGAATYGVNTYAGGIATAQRLANDATRFGPAIVTGASPAASPSAPTLAPSQAPTPAQTSSPTPTASPTPFASPSAETSPTT